MNIYILTVFLNVIYSFSKFEKISSFLLIFFGCLVFLHLTKYLLTIFCVQFRLLTPIIVVIFMRSSVFFVSPTVF